MSILPLKPHSKSRVEQQELQHIYVRYSPLAIAAVFFIIAVVSIPIGIVVIVCGDRTSHVSFRYDDVNNYTFVMGSAGQYAVDFDFNGTSFSTGAVARVDFTLHKSLSAPIYIEYVLDPFYQNYRWFAASVDSSQLRGGTRRLSKFCHPYRYPGEKTGEDISGYYNPCGAFPWSMYNDSISLYKRDATLICDGGKFNTDGTSQIPNNHCKKKGIALKEDVESSYKAPKSMSGHGPMWKAGGDSTATDPYQKAGYYYREPGHKIPSSLDEDVMVWLKMAFVNRVTKTYRIVEVDLPAGDYYFEVLEQFATAPISGRKYIRLATRSWIGEKNHVLGILLIVVGGVGFVLAIALFILQCFIAPG
ncbi:hypothetical protein ABB37_01087 [Leptomonas pyrrhocoris]|uniref:LEM3 (Ligand-effect modulator 3) family / CDC50 family n=1 Tax=Leptomonas pyrrhocoris TaxID=157538 RepID=A0A0N0DYV0_LEPPY|nr:hypothetical protein ABB37_01087 [Leptomonas pyrrhocoris]KPA84552.1 hypothetical protein ABB37_01087 [Leptomonas pyrrhocoris]|eukprot:XP_015662991.1 hypothetical protein ABB37_01087 [Leptomonas pyrrhocoris]